MTVIKKCNEEKGIFPTSTQILESVFVPGRNIYLMYVIGKQHGYRILKFSMDKKNNNFIEFKVHLIHSKQIPHPHNTVLLILWFEGDVLMGVKELIS